MVIYGGLAVTAIVSRRHVHSSRGIGNTHTMLYTLLCSLHSSPRAQLPTELWVPTSPWEDIGLDALQISAIST